MRSLLLVAVLVVIPSCAGLLENQAARANALSNLGEADATSIQVACELAAGRTQTPDALLRVAVLCHRALSDYERLVADLVKLDEAVTAQKSPEEIEALLFRAGADEARIVQDLEDISQEASQEGGSTG